MQRSVATKASPRFSAVSVLIIGLAFEDCYVVLRTPHNDKELLSAVQILIIKKLYNQTSLSFYGTVILHNLKQQRSPSKPKNQVKK